VDDVWRAWWRKQSAVKTGACCAIFAAARPFCFMLTPQRHPMKLAFALSDLWVMLEECASGCAAPISIQGEASNPSLMMTRWCHRLPQLPLRAAAGQCSACAVASAPLLPLLLLPTVALCLPPPLKFWGLVPSPAFEASRALRVSTVGFGCCASHHHSLFALCERFA